MNNRRENLRRSLGLTEYPWSSDDEDDPQSNQEPGPSSRRPSESHNSNQSGPSGAGTSASSISPTRRNQTRLERDLFWSLLNNPNRMSAPGPSRAYEPPCERIDLNNPITNIQRILAIKRLTRNLRTNSSEYSRTRNIIFSPMPPLNTIRRIRRRPSSRAPLPYTRSSIIPAVIGAFSTSAARTSQESERDPNSDEETRGSMSPENENNDDNAEEEENVDDTSGERASGDEDAEEVDGGGEENREEEDEEPQVEPEPDAEAGTNEEPPAPAENSTTEEAQVSQTVKRKRESSGDREPQTVKDFNQVLLHLLECPVCLEVMEPPMTQCRRGHLVCGRCRARLTDCPVCRTPFSSVRNRAMESVSEMLSYPCRHGCGGDVRLRRRAAHEASCAARRYRCPAPACARRPPLAHADLPHHFQSEHLSILKVGRRHKVSVKVNTERHEHWLVMAAQELFHMRVDVDTRAWGAVLVVAYIGPKCNASNFLYKVTVLGQQNGRKVSYTRFTHSDLESTTLNVRRQDCFHLTMEQTAHFVRQQPRNNEVELFLDFMVEIKKCDVPTENALDEPAS